PARGAGGCDRGPGVRGAGRRPPRLRSPGPSLPAPRLRPRLPVSPGPGRGPGPGPGGVRQALPEPGPVRPRPALRTLVLAPGGERRRELLPAAPNALPGAEGGRCGEGGE